MKSNCLKTVLVDTSAVRELVMEMFCLIIHHLNDGLHEMLHVNLISVKLFLTVHLNWLEFDHMFILDQLRFHNNLLSHHNHTFSMRTK